MRIAQRFNGPADSANGGITCGMLAAHLDAPVVQVTLRKPPPLETELTVREGQLLDVEVLIAEAVAATVDLVAPPAITVAAAQEAATRFAGFADHPFPTCFVCGTARTDGLGLTAGPVSEGVVATDWTPTESSAVMVWAALDCPGGWSADLPGRPMVLGRMATRIDALPTAGETHVVQGWLLGGEGRKVHTGSALYGPAGDLLAVATATWITIS
jgi:hypothetical protein